MHILNVYQIIMQIWICKEIHNIIEVHILQKLAMRVDNTVILVTFKQGLDIPEANIDILETIKDIDLIVWNMVKIIHFH